MATEIIKKLLGVTRNKKKQHNKYFILAKSKLNSIETLISQALIDLEIISHEEFKTIVNEKEKYEKMKESIKMIKVVTNQIKILKTIKVLVEMMKMHYIYIYIYIYTYIYLNIYKMFKTSLKTWEERGTHIRIV